MFIRSERLFLRPGWPEDWQELHTLMDDEAVVRDLARVPWPYRAEHAQAFADMPQSARHPHFIVTLPGANGTQVIGAVGFAEDPDRKGEAELGYWIARKHWRRGYATEAARAALSVARTLGHQRVFARHFVDNPASGRVLRKLGFTRTGEAKPCHSLSRGRADPAYHYALELVSPASDPADPNMFRRAA